MIQAPAHTAVDIFRHSYIQTDVISHEVDAYHAARHVVRLSAATAAQVNSTDSTVCCLYDLDKTYKSN